MEELESYLLSKIGVLNASEQVRIGELLEKAKKTVIEWTEIEEGLPICYESGSWDGKRSDNVLVELEDGTYDVGVLYSGYMDGSEFNDWYSKNDYEINVVSWKKIKQP